MKIVALGLAGMFTVCGATGAWAQDAGRIDKLCVDAALRSPANANSRVIDARVLRDAPAGFDKNNFPGFLRMVEFDVDLGSMKLTRIFRCQNVSGIGAFPYDVR